MGLFTFGKWKNQKVEFDNINDDEKKEFDDKLKEFVQYIYLEKKKGKIPLIIAGAGASASDVAIKDENETSGQYMKNGLPCLSEMIWKLRECVLDSKANGKEVCELKKLFQPIDKNMHSVDREWLGKVFTSLERSSDIEVKKIWESYCSWFFFECIKSEGDDSFYGALNTSTSKVAEQIAAMYDTLNALCFSANFDNYMDYALISDEHRNGIPIYDRELAEKYFKRNRRGTISFDKAPYNRCVLHANGDVFWLFCSGEKGEGYCPETGKKVPAFTKRYFKGREEMICEFCQSPLNVTMTMPGTYEKDYNTRAIITTIWKYISTKISAVITVGLSCNWDDVLLKFILQLIKERDIPLLDINNLSDKARDGQSAIIKKVVEESHLEACAYIASALDGTKKIETFAMAEVKKDESKEDRGEKKSEEGLDKKEVLEKDYRKLIQTLESTVYIQRLCNVSQLGLKSYWLDSSDKNERWNHSKEVANIAIKMYERLCKNSRKELLPFEQILVYTAGLLHDCGHLPFSHLLEDVFEELSWHLAGELQTFKHNHYTKQVIDELCKIKDCQLNNILTNYGVSEEEVIHCIEGTYGVNYIDAIINSAIDADKIAYIFTDAENTRKNLTLTREDFLEELLKNAYITQEGLIALDGQSAWYAMRLLDERKRLYDELYYDTRIRFLEAAAKYIITTYFVQKYNDETMWAEHEGNSEDLGNCHILNAIDDLYGMIDGASSYSESDLSASVSAEVKSGIERCMNLILNAKRSQVPEEPKEIVILKNMCRQLLGNSIQYRCDSDEKFDYAPIQDSMLERLVEKSSYSQLNAARKRIILNYPGTILIDIYSPAQYFSSPSTRKARNRIDGTNCGQEMILIPKTSRDTWLTQNSLAEIGLLEYSRREHKENEKIIFHVFKIGRDSTACDHAVNMLKKELDKIEVMK